MSDSRVRYLKGHLWLTVKAATGTVDPGAYDKNEQVFFEDFYPWKTLRIVRSRNHLQHE